MRRPMTASRVRCARPGLSAVEVLLGLALLLALFVPVHQLFLMSREAGLKSRLAYMALQAARDEIDDLRVEASLAPTRIAELRHRWLPVAGRMLARLESPEPLVKPGDLPALTYPDDYRRIYTKVDVHPPDDGPIFPVTVLVRWQEKGESMPDGNAGDRQGASRFDILLTPGAPGAKK